MNWDVLCLKAIVTGYGSIGKRHVKNLLEISDYDIAICTKQRPKSYDTKRCTFFDTLQDCFSEVPTIGLVTNVSSAHVETALELASAGCHLFIEKPLSNSLKNIEKLSKIVKKKKLVTLMGCNLRFHSCIQKIKELITNGKIGKIISARVECGTYLPDWHPYEDYRGSYASRNDLGGGVVLTCIHELDYLYWFFGNVKEVFSMTGKYSNLETKADDLSAIILKFNNNVIAEVHLDYFQRPETRSCKIIGVKGTIYWDSTTNEVKLYSVEKKRWKTVHKIKNYDKNEMYVKELRHFIRCVDKKEKSINDISQGIYTLKIALTVIKSSKLKRVLSTSA